MSVPGPSDPPPSYEEVQGTAPYPTPYPQQYPGYPKGNWLEDLSGGSGYPPQVPGSFPPQQGYPPQQYGGYGAPPPPPGAYPPQGPYPGTTGAGQNYTYPTAVAAYNQQGVIVQPGVTRQTGVGLNNYQRRRKIIFSVAAVIFAFIFLSIIIRVIL